MLPQEITYTKTALEPLQRNNELGSGSIALFVFGLVHSEGL